jgi:RNA polymerase sigma factor (sigma-70 family)
MKTWESWTDAETVTDEALIQHWRSLVKGIATNVARTYHLNDDDRDDLAQECFLKLLKMPESARPHIVYARTTIKNAIRTGISKAMSRGGSPTQKWRDYSTTDYESAVAGHNSDDEVSYPVDYLTGSPSPEAALVDSLSLDAALTTLTPRERASVEMERTLEAIAKDMGCSTEWVRQIRRRALSKLKRALARK